MPSTLDKYAGAGQETIEQSESMPLIKILQDMSPEVNERKDGYIEGAKAGMLMFAKDKSLLGDSIRVVPLASKSIYVEWVPRSAGGGMVASHPLSIVTHADYSKDGFIERLGDNDLIFTTYWMVLFQREGDEEWEKGLLAMTKTQLKASRKMAGEIGRFMIPDTDKVAPTFARAMRLFTTLEKNKADQEYFNFDFTFEDGILDAADLEVADAELVIALKELPSPQEPKAIEADLDVELS